MSGSIPFNYIVTDIQTNLKWKYENKIQLLEIWLMSIRMITLFWTGRYIYFNVYIFWLVLNYKSVNHVHMYSIMYERIISCNVIFYSTIDKKCFNHKLMHLYWQSYKTFNLIVSVQWKYIAASIPNFLFYCMCSMNVYD